MIIEIQHVMLSSHSLFLIEFHSLVAEAAVPEMPRSLAGS